MANRCSRCKKTFDSLDAFPIDERTGFYRQSCKICYEKQKIYYQENKEYIELRLKETTSYITCDCGKKIKVVNAGHIKQHLATKYHIRHTSQPDA